MMMMLILIWWWWECLRWMWVRLRRLSLELLLLMLSLLHEVGLFGLSLDLLALDRSLRRWLRRH
jgi:hypothetical protein